MTPCEALETVLDDIHSRAIVDHRKALKKPLTAYAATLLAKRLAECSDPNAAADLMIEMGWQSITREWFDKRNGNGNHAGARAPSPSEDLMRSFGLRARTEH